MLARVPEYAMQPIKTLHEREQQLQSLLATPQGRKELEELASRYQADGGRARPGRTSLITYILVHERGEGRIVG
jgi:hypothetical protein